MEILAWCLGILGFLAVLMVSIGLHEAGHMAAAKAFKLHVPKFFIGFGKTVWSKKTAKTEYGIKWIPLGGFVRIEDPDAEKQLDKLMLSHVKPWKRNIIFAAGPFMNILLGTVLLIIMLMVYPGYMVGTTIEGFSERSSAAAAGIQEGDTILAVDGNPVETRDELVTYLQSSDAVSVTVDRVGDEVTIPVELSSEGTLGVTLSAEEYQRSLGESFAMMGDFYMMNLEAITALPQKIPLVVDTLFGAERDPEAPVSMITVGNTYGETAADMEIPPADKLELFIMYSGLINIGLGAVNLLPFMPLDGGRILIATIDSIKMRWNKLRKQKYEPVSEDWINAMTAVSLSMVGMVFVLLLLTDIVLIGRGEL